jgi:hypothetical protein
MNMDEISATNTIITSAVNAVNFFDLLYSKVDAIKSKNLSIQNYLRAYYFEVITNLELLNSVNISKFKLVSINSSLFQKFINRLDTSIGATILFSEEIDKSSDLYKLLQSKGRIQNKNKMLVTYQKGIESIYSGKILYENILQAISFTVIKIEILKRLSTVDSEEIEYLNNLQLEKRIVNIKERFIMIKTVMDQIDGIQALAR